MSRRLITALFGAGLVAACAREVPPPPVVRQSDVELKSEIVTIEARVPQHATLDAILRSQQLTEPFVVAAIDAARSVFNPRQLHSDRPYRLVRSLDGMLREFEYQIDADRFLRIISRPIAISRRYSTPKWFRTTSRSRRRRGPRPHRQRSSVGHRRDGRNRGDHSAGDDASPISSAVRSISTAICNRATASTILVEKSSHDGQFSGYGAVHRRAIPHRRPRSSRVPLDGSGDRQAGLLRRKRPIAETILPALAAASSSRASRQDSRGAACIPVYRTYRAHLGIDYGAPARRAGRGRRVRHGHIGRMERRRRQHGAPPARERFRELLPASVGVCAAAFARACTSIRDSSSAASARPAWRTGPHLDYRLQKERRIRQPADRAPQTSAGRTDPRRTTRGISIASADATR